MGRLDQRNERIRERAAAGEQRIDIAADVNLTRQRVDQIVGPAGNHIWQPEEIEIVRAARLDQKSFSAIATLFDFDISRDAVAGLCYRRKL